ncbi:MAG: SDR family oxidoreductase [Verrucomicrobiales bacterium]|nr:SDR family oxidoreductase [Verrucomicrobiales bacterium]
MREILTPRSSSLAGQIAIVTGAGSGIGRATSLALAREGASVIAVGKTAARVASVVDEVQRVGGKGACLGLTLDVRREEDMQTMVAAALDRFGAIDLLVASAGILRGKSRTPKLVVHLPADEWNEILETNLKGVFLSNREVLAHMISRQQGQIVNISSASGRHGRAYDSAYSASKFAIIGFTEALAQEVWQHNIRVQVLLPGAVDTPILDQNGPIPRPQRVLSATQVADFIIHLVTQAPDSTLVGPTIEAF